MAAGVEAGFEAVANDPESPMLGNAETGLPKLDDFDPIHDVKVLLTVKKLVMTIVDE